VVGPAGRAGRDGTNGFGQLVYSQGIGDPIEPTQTGDDVVAACPPGTFPTGGDAFYIDDNGDFFPNQPVAAQGFAVDANDVPAAWIATPTENTSPGDLQLVVDVVCANANDVGFASTPQGKANARGLKRHGLTVRRP
jgi:hypothetical protein